MRLGKIEIDALTCPPGQRDRIVFDDGLPGFGIRVTASGLKVFLFQYRHGETVRRLRLGRYGDLTPAQARKLAEVTRGEVAAGRDPVGVRKAAIVADKVARAEEAEQAAVDAFTFERLIERWETERLAHRSRTYQREAGRALRWSLAALLPVPAAKVTATMIREEFAQIGKRLAAKHRANPRRKTAGPTSPEGVPGQTIQHRVRAYAHAMFAWGMKNELVTGNPVAAVHVEGRPVARERVLTDSELGEVWRGTLTLGWPWGPFFRFLILTLQREAEVSGLRWFELTADLHRWELPSVRTKNRRPHIVHLAEPAREILRAAPRLTMPPGQTPSPFVFTSKGKTPVSGYSHAKMRLDNWVLTNRIEVATTSGQPALPVVPWRIHDLRRTGVTVMARLGVRYEVTDKILNHVGGAIQGVAAVYQRHEYLAEREAALALWAGHVLALGKPPEDATTPA